MKETSKEKVAIDEMPSEYDFTNKKGVRGKYYRAYREGHEVRIRKADGNTREPRLNEAILPTLMRRNAEFIVFAVNQAKEAEAFGFTRNECCRNLKTALHQYWQNKTLGLHGQSQKAKIPRSKSALDRPLNECVVEHVVPQMAVVNRLMDMELLTEAAVTELLTQWFTVMLVTREEHARLNASGLRSTMPRDWDCTDVFSRYAAVGIEQADQPPHSQ